MIALTLSGVLTLLGGIAAPSLAARDDPGTEVSGSVVYRDPKPDVFMTEWLVCGPFTIDEPTEAPEEPEPTKKAFTHDFLAEHGGEAQVEPVPGMTHHLRGKEQSWQHVTSPREFVSFVDLYGMRSQAAAYASAEIEMAAPTQAVLGLGSDDAVRVWLNGELVHSNWTLREFVADQDQVPIQLHQGRNRLLVKVYNGYNAPWGFACRLMGPEARSRSSFAAASRWELNGNYSSSVRELLDRLEGDVAAGPDQLTRNWVLRVAEDYSLASLNGPLPPWLRQRVGHVAQQLSALVPALPAPSRDGTRYLIARFYQAAGRVGQAVPIYEEMLRSPGDHSGARYLLRTHAGGRERGGANLQ